MIVALLSLGAFVMILLLGTLGRIANALETIGGINAIAIQASDPDITDKLIATAANAMRDGGKA